jgi:RecB family exonuclease
MEFGSIIHKVLDEFHQSTDLNVDQLYQLLDKHWRSESFEYLIRETEFRAQAKDILNDYFQHIKDDPPNVVATEAKFEFSITDQDIKIVGKIDRIDSQDNQLDVVDYKTSQSKDLKASSSLQLALYVEAIKRNAIEDVKGEPGYAKLYYLRHPGDPIDQHDFSTADWKKIEEKITLVAKNIRRNEFEPLPEDHKCNYCDYREFLCPSWESETLSNK